MRAFPRSLLLATITATVSAALLAGCGSSDEPRRQDAEDTPASTAPPATPTETPETTAPPSSPEPATLSDRLLVATEVPGLNARWHWQEGQTTQDPAAPFGLCAKGSLSDIGATQVIERSYFPPDDSDDNAGEQVAEFPDAKTATLAWSVLGAWHDRCSAKAAGNPGLKVRPFSKVASTAGEARWYLLSWSPADDEVGRFETLGMIKAGTRIAVLRITHSGQDHSYPPGEDPMEQMLTAAAAKLG